MGDQEPYVQGGKTVMKTRYNRCWAWNFEERDEIDAQLDEILSVSSRGACPLVEWRCGGSPWILHQSAQSNLQLLFCHASCQKLWLSFSRICAANPDLVDGECGPVEQSLRALFPRINRLSQWHIEYRQDVCVMDIRQISQDLPEACIILTMPWLLQRVECGRLYMDGRKKGETAHIISGASGARFSMYLAKLEPGGSAPMPPSRIERFIFVLEGSLILDRPKEEPLELLESSYAYIPPNFPHRLRSETGGGFLVYEQKYKPPAPDGDMDGAGLDDETNEVPLFVHGLTDEQPVLETPGEMFALRKLLPQTHVYDFNIHVMDFQPGEHLFVKEVHYNQHGLMLLQGKGIYRLADKWYPVQAGDSIWMAPFVVQWYAALGTENSRYIINKDTRPPEL